ncbi:glycosyltransferase [Paenibacillus silagei]|uniref:Carbonic anhydrase/acetyltransferase-like protein (Isoleucine patch superfamily) n=1 Tax=Paenibacillus silagei TaxID=1670801 RepID=A0ABS4P226_9BACL|nr:glycosyltransferase [Paenibacillus silagei]MBP2116351.1 carbonic anhydrase/acetyltransferase-like protein (isoleucine patch superfamily) [Paenibacillus silagei]
MHTIPPSLYYRFYRYGTGCKIASDGVLTLPEQTAIGTGVLVRECYRWDIPSPARDGSPRIVIGDRCDCSRFLTITATGKVELKADVITGPHVYISDARQPWETEDSVSTITIGEGSWIGAHSSILGHVKIGRGCVIGAGSVVLRDVPDYCVVAGNPAEFRRIYEPSSGEWIRIHSEEEARETLERRSKEPLLSICITVRNQAEELRHCLESIYAQTGDSGLIEVCVLDDASADESGEVAHHYAMLYRSFRYLRNPDSVAGDFLPIQAAAMAGGKFIMLHDSGASFLPNALAPLLNVLDSYSDCGILLIHPMHTRRPPQPERLEGLSEYVKHSASSPFSPPSVVLNRRDWERSADSEYPGASINPWMSRQYALLQSNPLFCLCRYTMTGAAGHTGSA